MSHYEDDMEVVSLQDLLDDARYEEAEQLLAVVEADGVAWAASLRALCLSDLGRAEEAMKAARRGIELDPTSAFAHWVVGALWCDRNHLGEAALAGEEALRLDSTDPANWALMAQVHGKRGQWKECLNAADAGLARDPGNEACASLRALALRGTSAGDEWSTEVHRLTRHFPASSWARAGSGWGLLEAGRAHEAREAFEQALALDPTSSWARQGLQESIKAQNPIYAALLRFFIWFGRIPARTRWVIILGGLLGYRTLRGWTESNPELALLAYPFMAAWVVFIVLSWTSGPLSDFVLSRTAVGKRLVRGADLLAANLIVGLLCAALALSVLSTVIDFRPGVLSAMGLGFLIIPVAAVFQCSVGWPRTTMAFYAAGVALLALAPMFTPEQVAAGAFVAAVGLSALGSWIGTFLASRTVKA